MSLKAFHIFFVSVSILLAFGFAGWELYAYAQQGGVGNVVLGVGSLVAGVGLVVYLRAVIRKLRQFNSP
jgi:hypothetical protein